MSAHHQATSTPATPLPAEVADAASAGDPVALTRMLVAIPSVNPTLSPGGAGEAGVAAACAAWLGGWGLEVSTHEVAPQRPNVVARLPGRGPTLLLNGHLDTVGVEGMAVDPFAATLSDGRVWGRGSCDMKAGVAAILATATRLAASDTRPSLVVALTADEEHASVGMDALVRSGLGADMAVVCEPTGLAVMPAHKGFVWIRALFRGVAAHGSRSELGVDAVRHAALFLAALDGYEAELNARPDHPLLGHGSFHAGTIEGGTAESVYPDRCTLLLERRTLPGETPAAVLDELRRVLDEVRRRVPKLEASLEVTLERPGTEVGGDSSLVQGLLRAVEARGRVARVEGMTAWVDAALLNEGGIPAVCFGPGDIAQAHTADEWVETEQIVACTDVLERFARALAG